MKSTSKSADRDRIKGMVVSGDPEGIEAAITKGLLKRKRHKVMSVDRDNRQIDLLLTNNTVDRDSELVLPSSLEANLEYYLENPVLLFNHDFSIPAVGKMVDYNIGETEVTMIDRFAPDSHALAKVLWELYSAEDPFMRMFSIGFLPIQWSNDPEDMLEGQKGLTFFEIEMFEHSCVNVGANRYALSKVPSAIATDPVLRDVYGAIVEEPSKAGEAGGGGKDVSQLNLKAMLNDTEVPVIVKLPKDAGSLSIQVESESDFGEVEGDAPTSDKTKEVKKVAKNKIKRKPKSEASEEVSLASQLNKAIGDDDDRADIIKDLAEAAGVDAEDVEGILEGDVDSLTQECLEDFAGVLDTDPESLIEAADSEGLLVSEASDDNDNDDDGADDEGDDGDETEDEDESEKSFSRSKGRSKEMNIEKARQKFYSMRGRIKGTYEERVSNVQQALRDYFEDNSDELDLDDDDYYYLDLDVIGTEETKVLFYCWNNSKAYKMDYEIDEDGMVDLSNMSPIRFTYEELPEDMM